MILVILLNIFAQISSSPTYPFKGLVRSFEETQCKVGLTEQMQEKKSCSKIKALYNIDKKLEEITFANSAYSPDYKTLYMYNEKGMCIEEIEYFIQNDSLKSKSINIFDNSGNCIQTHYQIYNPSSQSYDNAKSVFSYNYLNSCTEGYSYINNDSILNRYTFKYDKNNKPIQKNIYLGNNEKPEFIEKYTYNTDSTYIIEKYKAPKLKKKFAEEMYSANSELLEVRNFDIQKNAIKSIIKYKYTLDNVGNWIQITCHYHDVLSNEVLLFSVIERDITYW